MTILKFNQKNVDALGSKLIIVLKKFAEDNGLEYKGSGGRYSGDEFKPKIAFRIKAENAKDGMTPEGRAYKEYADQYGLKSEWLNVWFASMNGGTFKITGWNTRARKNKVLLESKDGKMFHCDITHILRHQGRLNSEAEVK